MPQIRRLPALLLTGLAFAAAACGGDDDEPNGGQSDAPIVDDDPQGNLTEPNTPTPAPGEE